MKKLLLIIATVLFVQINNAQTITDIDSNVYNTVTIGTQVWMKENLKTTKYRNGDVIPNVTDTALWNHLTSGAYCNYDNNNSNVATYGRLYNWYVINDNRNVCPTGWHVPNDSEWTILVNYLGGDTIAGGKMKEAGTAHWYSPNTGATNSSGFTALAGGQRAIYRKNPSFDPYSYVAFGLNSSFWSYELNGKYMILDYTYTSVFRDDTIDKMGGLSIRCLKDLSTGINNLIKDDQIVIFPNPSAGLVNLSFGLIAAQKAMVEIHNLQGTQVFSKTFQNTTSATIDLKGHPTGIYMVKVIADGVSYEEKIVKE
jgi:uncharacterized protein (TIGR02145 family)